MDGGASVHVIPLFKPAGDVQQGFARIINHSHGSGTVRITGTDDAGRSRGPVTLSLNARETRHFNSDDLEAGNASKGLSGGLGDGQGNWRLRLESDLDLDVGAYIRTSGGFLASVHDVVRRTEVGGEVVHHVPIFNPASNRKQVSSLRLANLTRGSVDVTIRGRDDAGRDAPGGEVELTLPAGGARQVSAQALEAGDAGFSGRLGDGAGKWQLFVSADGEIEVVSLMSTPTGHLTNLSVSGLGEQVELESPNPVRSTFRDCAQCPDMVVVPAGTYRMGSPADEADRDSDEGPVHQVTIAEPFAVGRYEVTFAQWDACHAAGRCSHRPDDQGWGRGNRPVVDVSWWDAQEYVRWLSDETGQSYRLLSESEWEYMARAGTSTHYWWGDAIGHNRANCDGCGSPWDALQTAPVGSFSANAFGLHDVHGNVYEWVQDCYHANYDGAPGDGSAWETQSCQQRRTRGGSWNSLPRYLRSANRGSNPPSDRGLVRQVRVSDFVVGFRTEYIIGFRVARALGSAGRHTLPLFRPAGQTQQGFARIINRSHRAGTVRIDATDDAGRRHGPSTLSLDARATRHFNSEDLEEGNASKGLSGGLGQGTGDWRLELTTDLDIEPSAYIRTPDGFLTAMHAVAHTADVTGETEHHVPIFNPASNRNQVSWLRVANLSNASVDVAIRARDDSGQPARGGVVRLTLPPNGAQRMSAQQLEQGDDNLNGRLGTGTGKWQLFVTADGPVEVVSLLQSPTGHLSNLSTVPRDAPSSPDDGNNTIAEAVDITIDSVAHGRIDAPGDVDYYRMQLPEPGTVTVWATGDADTEIAFLDGDGNDLGAANIALPQSSPTRTRGGSPADAPSSANGAGKVSVTTGLDDLFVRIRGRQGGRTGQYTLHNEFAENLPPRIRQKFTDVAVKAGGRALSLDLSNFFVDPEGGNLEFGVSFPGGTIGPVSLGVTISGSIMEITSPANMRPGPVSVEITASDPFGLFAVQVLKVEVQPKEDTTDLTSCISARIKSEVDFCSPAGMHHYVDLTNSCSQQLSVWYQWSDQTRKGMIFLDPGETDYASAGCVSDGEDVPTLKYCASVKVTNHRCEDESSWTAAAGARKGEHDDRIR